MSKPQKWSLGAALAGLLALGAGWAVVVGAGEMATGGEREIVLEARGMAFYLAGDPTSNPELRLRPGERVRLTLVNRDPGLFHDLAVPALGVSTPLLAAGGARHSVRLEAPLQAGAHDYVCTLHEQMMRGRVVVE